MELSDFNNLHSGATVLLVGNAPNLKETPPEWFDYPSFGMNTICKYATWRPTYYTAVDSRVMWEFGEEIVEKYGDIPKFVPTPNLDKWQGPNFYRFYHRPGKLWPWNNESLWPRDFLSLPGITYGCVMHIAMQLAYFMGFSRMLVIGMEHKPRRAQNHFWGVDHCINADAPLDEWFMGYKTLREEMKVEMLNISPNTYVPEEILPRDDWRKYVAEPLQSS